MLLNTLKWLQKGSAYLGFMFIMGSFVVLSVACSDSGTGQNNQVTASSVAESNKKSDDDDKDKSKDKKSEFKLEEAKWDEEDNRLKVKGKGTKRLKSVMPAVVLLSVMMRLIKIQSGK